MFRWIKQFLPRGLFGRSLMLMLTPIVVVQIVTAIVFYQAHWETVSRRLALGLAGEIAFLVEARQYRDEPLNEAEIYDMAIRNMHIEAVFLPGARLPQERQEIRFYSILDNMLALALSERLSLPRQFDTRRDDGLVEVLVQLENGVLRVRTQDKRVFSTTTYVVILWMVGTSLILMTIAVLFLRNQVRPLRRLASAAEAFGKGREDPPVHPAGSTEVRQAAAAFLDMQERIRRHLSQRTDMLAGVSHDLRTPLTRMKLQLALMGDSEDIEALQRDVEEMERMVSGYLDFARGEEGERIEEVDLGRMLDDLARISAGRPGAGHGTARSIAVSHDPDLLLPLRPGAMRRCLENLVQNALRHGNRVAITARRDDTAIDINIDDDGPGIPEAQREAVFRPFFRLDRARNPDTGGVGLGLTIARDVVRSHGGEIHLETAPQGGLRVAIRLPV
ncbi:ATP-binding protein [Marinibaculum pumilum]|uniref:histidine kinase n=1 Tax=Marinibaculum pumilum TaxID=1766165 RepID=A0ABV7L4R5_9PROT